jgi:hypothetical protein
MTVEKQTGLKSYLGPWVWFCVPPRETKKDKQILTGSVNLSCGVSSTLINQTNTVYFIT